MKCIYGLAKSRDGGIYCIKNLKNNKIYIGSTSKFGVRFSQHKKCLLTNKHTNKYLQNDFNKYGIDKFVIEVMETVIGDENARLLVEQKYIDQFYDNQQQCFNLSKSAFPTRNGKPNKDPEKIKLLCASASKKSWSDPKLRAKRMKTFQSESFRKQQSEKQKEVSKNPTFGNSAEAHKKRYADPDFKKKHSQALKDAWAKDDGSRKKQTSIIAKKVYEANKEKIADARLKAKAKYYGKVISPTGEVFEIYNAQQFIRDNNFSQSFYDLLNGKIEKYKGWLLC